MSQEIDTSKIYLTQLYEAYKYANTEFDKSLTYISSGILTVSFVFIEKIVPLTNAVNKEYLITGWKILGASIVVSSFSHLVNIYSLRYYISNYKEVDNIEQKKIRKKEGIVSFIITSLTLFLIIFGSLKITTFIKDNIVPYEINKQKNSFKEASREKNYCKKNRCKKDSFKEHR
jgi:hypothetical protein